jgi:glyoxylase-like metal-dependent hydrolase (beta-lactamase superfamily II)
LDRFSGMLTDVRLPAGHYAHGGCAAEQPLPRADRAPAVILRAMTRIEVPGHDLVGIRAKNPGPFTLSGTNSWLVGRGSVWLVDPGPADDEHLSAIRTEIGRRGALGGIALTHDHPDHAAAVPAIRAAHPDAPLAAARGEVDVLLRNGDTFGPLEVLATPGHAPDHLAFVTGTAALTGDAVLGEGSVFISPDPGALVGYLQALGRLRERDLDVLCPGHGPPVHDPKAKIDEYVAHRLERERRLLDALDRGKRSIDCLLAEAWSDAPARLRPAATVTLAAHLDKLADEGRLPAGVERPALRL